MPLRNTIIKGDHRDRNGLVGGMIPKGCACPCLDTCVRVMPICPTELEPALEDFSCALARMCSIQMETYKEKLEAIR